MKQARPNPTIPVRNRSRGSVILHVLVGIGALSAVTMAMWSSMGLLFTSSHSSSAKATPTMSITATSVAAAARIAGLDCENLLAANVSSGDFAAILEDVVEYLDEHPSAIAERPSGPQAIFEAGIASLTEPQQTALATIRANAAWKVPAPYKLMERSQTEWIALRDALADEMIVARDGGEVLGSVTTLLGNVRGANDGLVQDALDRITNGAAAQSAWTAAVATAVGN